MAELAMGEYRDRAERRAARLPTQEYAHLKLANVKFQIACESFMTLAR